MRLAEIKKKKKSVLLLFIKIIKSHEREKKTLHGRAGITLHRLRDSWEAFLVESISKGSENSSPKETQFPTLTTTLSSVSSFSGGGASIFTFNDVEASPSLGLLITRKGRTKEIKPQERWRRRYYRTEATTTSLKKFSLITI